MRIGIQTPGIHHVSLRSANLQRSRQFYARRSASPSWSRDPTFHCCCRLECHRR